MAKDQIIRFAFGTRDNPGSSVWRVCVRKKTGDTYVVNSPVFGNSVHFSIHASGKMHMKITNKQQRFPSPQALQAENNFEALHIQFPLNYPQYQTTTKHDIAKDVFWVGWPRPGQLKYVRLVYCPREEDLRRFDTYTQIGPTLDSTLFDKPHKLFVFCRTRDFMPNEPMDEVGVLPR